jgi:hypothetical protein
MKRRYSSASQQYAHTTGDIKKDLSAKQLAGIGAVAMAYNKVEEELEELFGIATGLQGQMLTDVSARIHGIDGKIAIIRSAADANGVDDDDERQLEEALGAGVFGRYKGYRDNIVHARVINAAIGIGKTYKRSQINEILLSENALNILYEHLVILSCELDSAANVLMLTIKIKNHTSDDQEITRLEAERSERSVQFRGYRHKRQSLPPIPEFPSEDELREADVQWTLARQAERMATLLVLRRRRQLAFRHRS